MRKTLRQSVAAGALIAASWAANPALAHAEADPINDRIAAIQAKYAPQLAQLQADGNALKQEGEDNRPSDVGAMVGVDVKVSTHRENIILKIPEFTMGLQRIVLTVPEVAMREQRWVYGTPSVRMKRVQVGVHPEWYGPFHMEWKANYMDVPEPFMQEQVTILHIPEFKMGNQEILLHLPEVAMREQRWSFDVPDFTVKDVHVEMQHMSQAGHDLEARGAALSQKMKTETDQVLREELPKKRAEVAAGFAAGEKQLIDAIAEAHRFNVDTSKPFPDGQPALDDMLNSLHADRDQALRSIDDQIAQLVDQPA